MSDETISKVREIVKIIIYEEKVTLQLADSFHSILQLNMFWVWKLQCDRKQELSNIRVLNKDSFRNKMGLSGITCMKLLSYLDRLSIHFCL